MAVVTSLKETSRLTLFFGSKSKQIWNNVQSFKRGITQKFPRIGRLQFWQLGQTYSLKLTKSVSSESWKKLQFFSVPKDFSSICSQGHLLPFWQTQENSSSLFLKLHFLPKKLKGFNNLFQKCCSVSVLLDTHNVVLLARPGSFPWIPSYSGQSPKSV